MIYSKKILLTVMIVLWYFYPGKASECKTGAPSTSLTWSNVATSRLIELHSTHSEKVTKLSMKKEVWKIIGLKMQKKVFSFTFSRCKKKNEKTLSRLCCYIIQNRETKENSVHFIMNLRNAMDINRMSNLCSCLDQTQIM